MGLHKLFLYSWPFPLLPWYLVLVLQPVALTQDHNSGLPQEVVSGLGSSYSKTRIPMQIFYLGDKGDKGREAGKRDMEII